MSKSKDTEVPKSWSGQKSKTGKYVPSLKYQEMRAELARQEEKIRERVATRNR